MIIVGKESVFSQAMARVWRDGQKKTVKIYRLLTTVRKLRNNSEYFFGNSSYLQRSQMLGIYDSVHVDRVQ